MAFGDLETVRHTMTPKEAIRRQEALRDRVRKRPSFHRVHSVAGADISVRNDAARAAIVLLSFPELELVEVATAVRPVEFPYIPGLLAFREMPALLEAFERLRGQPDVILVDGHGYAHPRRFGVACHLGVELDLPTIGVGKSRFIGEHREPAARRGSRTQLRHQGEAIGAVLRTRDGVRPIYVSIGHRIDLPTSIRLVLRCARKYRLPEPIRQADRAAGELPSSPSPNRNRS